MPKHMAKPQPHMVAALVFWVAAVVGLVLREVKLNGHIAELAEKSDVDENRTWLTIAQILYGVGVLGCLGTLVAHCQMHSK